MYLMSKNFFSVETKLIREYLFEKIRFYIKKKYI